MYLYNISSNNLLFYKKNYKVFNDLKFSEREKKNFCFESNSILILNLFNLILDKIKKNFYIYINFFFLFYNRLSFFKNKIYKNFFKKFQFNFIYWKRSKKYFSNPWFKKRFKRKNMFHSLILKKIRRKVFFKNRILRNFFFFNFKTMQIKEKKIKLFKKKKKVKILFKKVKIKKISKRRSNFLKRLHFQNYYFFLNNYILFNLNLETALGRKKYNRKFYFFCKDQKNKYFSDLRKGKIKKRKIKFFIKDFYKKKNRINFIYFMYNRIFVKSWFKKWTLHNERFHFSNFIFKDIFYTQFLFLRKNFLLNLQQNFFLKKSKKKILRKLKKRFFFKYIIKKKGCLIGYRTVIKSKYNKTFQKKFKPNFYLNLFYNNPSNLKIVFFKYYQFNKNSLTQKNFLLTYRLNLLHKKSFKQFLNKNCLVQNNFYFYLKKIFFSFLDLKFLKNNFLKYYFSFLFNYFKNKINMFRFYIFNFLVSFIFFNNKQYSLLNYNYIKYPLNININYNLLNLYFLKLLK